MRPSHITLVAAALVPGASAAAGVIAMAISHTGRRATPFTKRSDTYTAKLTNNISYGGYFASISVGTPGQRQDVILDTGSSDLWVLGSGSPACTHSNARRFSLLSRSSRRKTVSCVTTFDTSSSSSFTNLSTAFQIEYVDASTVKGEYFTDTVGIAGATIDTVQMGIARETDMTYGIMGLGFQAGESSSTLYPNIIDRFYTQGLIASRAYSLYLDDLAASSGSILFGGVDTDKYSGSLIAVPILKAASVHSSSSSSSYTSFSVTLSSVAAVSRNGTAATNYTVAAQAAVLDSGTTLIYLPEALATSIFATFGATYSETLGYATVACAAARSSNLSLAFQFGGAEGPVITVAASELVLSAGGTSRGGGGSGGGGAKGGQEAAAADSCAFGVSMAADAASLLGDTFLRSAYAVYDLDARQVALAQADAASASSRVVAIAGAGAIPGVTAVATGVVAAAAGASARGTKKMSGAARVGVQMAPLVTMVVGVMCGALLIYA